MCSTEPRALGLNVEDRPYFQTMLRTRDFVLSDYLISRASGNPRVMAIYPIMREDGTVAGAIMSRRSTCNGWANSRRGSPGAKAHRSR